MALSNQTLGWIAITASSHIVTGLNYRQQLKRERKQNAVNKEAVAALSETAHFLIDRADPETLRELKAKQDFWIQVLELPPSTFS